ncbi:MAG TPA: hypothetical protein VMF67_13590 [Rhizomicrobium sp.]|nr:hypothetical protein [Rhizomicrobium sp.]
MRSVIAVDEGDEQAGIGDTLHPFEKPLRLERSLGPSMLPASRVKPRGAVILLAGQKQR